MGQAAHRPGIALMAVGFFCAGGAAWATPSGEDLPQPKALQVGDNVSTQARILCTLPGDGHSGAFLATNLARLGNETILVVPPGPSPVVPAGSLASLSGWASRFEPDALRERHGLALPAAFVARYGSKPVIVATRIVPTEGSVEPPATTCAL